eukprot:scaffold16767_cov57-Phaeocystis_antarctica.AAC.2
MSSKPHASAYIPEESPSVRARRSNKFGGITGSSPRFRLHLHFVAALRGIAVDNRRSMPCPMPAPGRGGGSIESLSALPVNPVRSLCALFARALSIMCGALSPYLYLCPLSLSVCQSWAVFSPPSTSQSLSRFWPVLSRMHIQVWATTSLARCLSRIRHSHLEKTVSLPNQSTIVPHHSSIPTATT